MRLIDADEFKEHYKEKQKNCLPVTRKYRAETIQRIESFCRDIDAQPTVEAEPVRHGRWIRNENGDIICSECGKLTMDMQDEAILGADGGWAGFALKTPNYCSRCGAKMDGKEQ